MPAGCQPDARHPAGAPLRQKQNVFLLIFEDSKKVFDQLFKFDFQEIHVFLVPVTGRGWCDRRGQSTEMDGYWDPLNLCPHL